MANVVQFIHPGGEIDPRTLGYNGWNASGRHGRRLLRHQGEYVNAQNRIATGDLAFWNEYEAPTRYTPIVGRRRGWQFARYEHEIIIPVPMPAPVVHGNDDEGCCVNTDPCVFGETFKYSNCQQVPNGDLWNLSVGSLVLFGAYMHARFALDTVFVVGQNGIQYQVPTARHPIPFVVSREYQSVTLNNLMPRNRGRTYIDRFMFYRGARPCVIGEEVDCNSIFSFTPAKICGIGDYHERCMIDLNLVNAALIRRGLPISFSSALRQSHATIIVNGCQQALVAAWNEIVSFVRGANVNNPFVLGTHFDWR